jgi:branched-chain amino acid aminotransferase
MQRSAVAAVAFMPDAAPITLPEQLGFGRYFTERIFVQRYSTQRGWHDARIAPTKTLEIDAAASVLHCGQGVFEGTKAYRRPDGKVNLFRPEKNCQRFNASARRMGMPDIEVAAHLQAIEQLVALEQHWIPTQPGAALYIRPVMIATESSLEVRPSEQYLHFILLSPVGPYFGGGLNPISVHVERDYVRAALGGTGEAKTTANYAGTLMPTRRARERGYYQVLWLDAMQRRYVEELGGMNVAFVLDGERIVTPALTGTILAGVTRDSLLHLARDLGISMSEERIDIEHLLHDIDSGKITEAFALGTGAVIAPIDRFGCDGKDHVVNERKVGPLTQRLYAALTDIQYGRSADAYGWTRTLP